MVNPGKLKGMQNAILAFFLLFGTVAIFVYIVTVPILGKGITERAEVQLDIYTLENSLEAAKTYTETAFAYSLDQSCSDVSIGGGHTIGSPSDVSIGGKGYRFLASEAGFLAAVAEEARLNMQAYTERDYYFLGNKLVKMPKYSMDTGSGSEGVFLGAAATNNRGMNTTSASENVTVTLWKKTELQPLKIYCYQLWQKASQALPEVQAALDAKLAEELARLPAENTAFAYKESGQHSYTMQEAADKVFLQENGKTLPESQEAFASAFAGVTSSNAIVEPLKATLGIEPTCSEPTYDSTKDETSFSCGFLYSTTAFVKAEIQGLDSHWAHNGEKVALEKERFAFALKASNQALI